MSAEEPFHQREERLLSMVLDGLDDLYDQRFGAPVGRVRDTRAETWLVRLLIAVAAALSGSSWEAQLAAVANELQALRASGIVGDELGDAALAVTGDLRTAIAAAF
ncbi:MAG: hypothetical protein AAGA65_21565 [Actinomycetota bacterium]